MRYELKEPFQLITHGKDNLIEFIIVPAPTAKIASSCSILEQEYNKAVFTVTKQKEIFKDLDDVSKEELALKEIDKVEQVGYLLAMGNADLTKCYAGLKECIIKSNCTLNDEIRCSSSIYDEIPYKELKGLLGTYLVNFTNILR